MIPKIIHYCWLSGDPIPAELKRCMKSWEHKIPDYEFVLWDLNRFDINSSKWTKQTLERKKYTFASDYIRLFAVYNYGGIYLDMDIEVLKSFDDLLDNGYMLGYEDNKGGIEAACFGAEQGAVWVKKCLDHLDETSFVKKNGELDETTLPQRMRQVIEENDFNLDIKPADYFTAKSHETGKITITKNTYTIHHFAGTWKSKKYKTKLLMKYILIAILGEKRYEKIKQAVRTKLPNIGR